MPDARPRSYISRQQDIMDGAVWRDPEHVQEWVGEVSKSDPVIVFCAYGFHVGCKTAIALREAGFDAKYMKGVTRPGRRLEVRSSCTRNDGVSAQRRELDDTTSRNRFSRCRRSASLFTSASAPRYDCAASAWRPRRRSSSARATGNR